MALIPDGGSAREKNKYTPPPKETKPTASSSKPATSSNSAASSNASESARRTRETQPREDTETTSTTRPGRETPRPDDNFDWSDDAREIAEMKKEQRTEAAAKAGPPDFNKMTEEEQYDYLQQLVVEQASGDESAWKSGEREVNIVGIRSFKNGEPTSSEGNVYNDTIYVCWEENGKKRVEAFTASTDGGVWNRNEANGRGFGYYENGEYKGISHLADGHYRDTWVKGSVPCTELGGLRQAGDIRIHADTNNDGVIQAEERLGTNGEGVTVNQNWGIQFHPGGNGENVGTWSAGCQVIKGNEYARFAQLINNAPNQRFSYTLIDSGNLTPVDSTRAASGYQPQAQDTPAATPAIPATPATPATPGEPGQPATPATPATPAAPPTQAAQTQQNQETPPPNRRVQQEPVYPQPMPNYGATRDVGSAVEQQLQNLIGQAQWEISQGFKEGPGVMGLYQWYQMANMTKMPISSETRKVVVDILQQAGINVGMQNQQAALPNNMMFGSPLAALLNNTPRQPS